MKKSYYNHINMMSDLTTINRAMALDGWKPDVILGIARGGLVPAVYMSHWWEVPLVSCHVSLRDHKKCSLPSEIWQYLKDGKKVLIVDDICDSGETLEYVFEYYLSNTGDGFETREEILQLESQLRTAVLIYNEGQNTFIPDYCGSTINKVEDPSWIVYPWEI